MTSIAWADESVVRFLGFISFLSCWGGLHLLEVFDGVYKCCVGVISPMSVEWGFWYTVVLVYNFKVRSSEVPGTRRSRDFDCLGRRICGTSSA